MFIRIGYSMRNQLAILLLLVLFSQPTAAQLSLQVATYQYATNNRLANIKPLADHLASRCSCTTNVKSYESVNAMLTGMQANESDVVLMNTFGYLLLDLKQKDYKPLVALQIAAGKTSTYQSIIVVRKSSNLISLEGVKQHASSLNLLLVNPGSTSGNLVPRLGFASGGIDSVEKTFKSVSYSKNHAKTLQEIIDGNFDIGAFGSEEYSKALAKDSSILEKVNVVWLSSDIPLGPVMIKNSLNKKTQKCIKQELLTLHLRNKEALEAVKAGWTEAIPADRYVLITDKDYQRWLNSMGGKQALSIIRQFSQ
ncbi:hypothetical protein SanaruYs_36360 [Chryseotalea sanaruensis]|uniref:Phosphate/phosphite/phosphonate ABC transporter substrate-binding protein n=1 Tax=Chryseotalea sanaruensis TaxID=2482724 RepID=A0A401UES1_9BACT|nr:phosphate/phosphite/phosphonate ABC transporter substrate-binding protein [Chryseotalea sanaruensis]GCC53393.1 hypothetical protein SanaruYs_36360 [Chryseotalea sanaruensis]